ncbi:MAG: hypothetical protein RLY93_18865 [Sumerlaeia bacterium]
MITRNLTLALGAATLLAAPLVAQPSITHLQDITVSGLETTPTGIAVTDAGDAYLAGAEQRRIIKVTDVVTNSPSAVQLVEATSIDDSTTSGPVTWPLFRGLFTAAYDPTSNTLLFAGDQGTDGLAILVDPTDDSTTYQTAMINSGNRRVAGAEFYGNNVIAQNTAGTNYWQFNWGLAKLTGAGFYGGPAGGASRDLAVASNGDVLISFNNKFVGDGTSVGIHRMNDDVSFPLSLSGNSNVSNWYTQTVTNSSSIQGISVFTYLGDSTEYAVLCLAESDEIVLVDVTNPSNTVSLTDATNLTYPRDAVVHTVGSSQYLVVSNSDDGVIGGRVSVFGIDSATLQGSANVENWNLFY